MRLETRKGSTRLIVEVSGEWASVELWGANGYERGSSIYAKDLRDNLEEMLKALTYFRGAKAHASIATREMIKKVAN